MDGFDPENPKSIGLALVRLDGAMMAMHRSAEASTAQQMHAIAEVRSEMRRLGEHIDVLKPLAQRSADTGDNVKRIWMRIESMERQRELDKDNLSSNISTSTKKVDRMAAIAMGFSLAASVFSGIVYKIQSDNERMREERLQAESSRVNALDQRTDKIEIHLAGDSARPFQR